MTKKQKKILLITISGVVILGAGAFWWWTSPLNTFRTDKDLASTSSGADAGEVTPDNAEVYADTAVMEGIDPITASERFDEGIAATNDTDTKVRFYINKAVFLEAQSELDAAAEAAEQAHALAGDTLTTVGLLASIYESQGRNAEAAALYSKAASLVPDDDAFGNKSYYEGKASELRQ